MKKLLLLIIFLSINITTLYAHQPKLIKYLPSSNEPHNVIDPEISKAYYGKLSGEPHYYKIESDTEFSFYVGITIPKIDDKIKWISLEVLDQNDNLIFYEDGKEYEWPSVSHSPDREGTQQGHNPKEGKFCSLSDFFRVIPL